MSMLYISSLKVFTYTAAINDYRSRYS